MFRAKSAAVNMLSPNGRCATFSDKADGYVRGEGCVAIVVEGFENTTKPVWGTIVGSGIIQDGRTANLTSPNGPSQEAVILSALKKSCLEPNDIHFIETHGTGTRLGDPIEIQSIRKCVQRTKNTVIFGSH